MTKISREKLLRIEKNDRKSQELFGKSKDRKKHNELDIDDLIRNKNVRKKEK